jgi:uncharacterized protein YbjT (DUF2867 family)
MILVIGATGTLGSALLQQLAPSGTAVRVLVRTPERAQAFKQQGVDAHVGDLSIPETLPPALAGVDQIFFSCAADPQQTVWHRNLLRAAQQAGVSRIVKISASKATLDVPVPIKRWHAQSDAELMDSRLDYAILRAGGFMQNTFQWKNSILTKGCFFMPFGEARVAMVDGRDIAATAARLLACDEHWNGIHELTGPAAVSYDEVALSFSKALGRPVRYVRVSFDQARDNMIGYGMPEWLASAVTDTYRFMAAGNASDVSDAIERITGKPATSFDQFAQDSAAVFTQQAASGHA